MVKRRIPAPILSFQVGDTTRLVAVDDLHGPLLSARPPKSPVCTEDQRQFPGEKLQRMPHLAFMYTTGTNISSKEMPPCWKVFR